MVMMLDAARSHRARHIMHVSPLSWIALTCAVVAAGIMIYYLVRRPSLDLAGMSLMFLGLGVLPIMVALIGNVEGLDATERQGFCGSCHTMDMWIEDANDPDSEYFCAGITEDILTDLSKIQGLRVASKNAVTRYRGQEIDLKRVILDLEGQIG